jgi:SAM-dependent methyltransferase
MKPKSSQDAAQARTKTDRIGEFYTQHPYPPPIDNLDRAREFWKDENIHRAEFHLHWPNREYHPDLDILVAGCGTWQSAKFAISHPAARVTGVDISPTSLEYTGALKRKYDLNNLEVRPLEIEKVADLDHQFNMIVCTGVLHHLADPAVGLRALRSVLKPGGAMYLMLYAPYGRTGVAMFQEYCRKLGFGTSPQEINELTAVLRLLPQHHPLLSMLRGSRDSLDAQALVDALLNPRDRTYSVLQLFDFLESNDLRLGRWYWQAPYLPQCSPLVTTSHADRLAALPEREQYAAMELWRGLITNHDFVVYHGEDDEGLQIGFDNERYLGYVPVRRAWTMCMQQQLPPGAAGVLVNQTHLFNDLYLVVDALQKQMYDAIDGRRSIAEIVEQTEGDDVAERAGDFFERLWWYDQVVFDTSKAH